MKKPKKHLLDFKIDKLTNSIENAVSKNNFRTEVLPVSQKDLKTITKKNGWRFNWLAEIKETDRTVQKLVIVDNVNIIQGLISLTPTTDNVFMHLIESAPFNFGKNKIYNGVPGNLVEINGKIF